MFTKSNRLIALLLAVVLVLTGCGATTAASSSQAASSAVQSSSQPAAAQFPVTVTDALGRTVTIEAEPERIVSGYYITSSMLIALGLKDKAVGIEAKADTRPIYALAAPDMLELPNVGTAKEFDLEGCAALEPNLVILPVKLKDSAAALEQLGITVVAVNPENVEQLYDTIEMIGAATGTTERAQKLIDFSKERYTMLEELAKLEEKPNVYLGGNASLLSTAGAKMYQNSMIEAAGGVNVAAELEDSYWAEVSYEQLLAWNPDVIVLAPGATYTVADVLADPQLSGVKAVTNGAVYQMPQSIEAWDSPVPSTVLGSLWLASVLHPQEYKPEQFVNDTAAYYDEFCGVSINQSLLA